MLAGRTEAVDARPYSPSASHPGRENMERFQHLLATAARPLVIVGGPGWTRESCNDLARFVEANGLPCACAWRFQDLFDNRHPNYPRDVGIRVNPAPAARARPPP